MRFRRTDRDSPEFARVANLSDAVFAIAMTLLVLTLDVPEVTADRLGAALIDRLPQFVAFGLAFALVANIWWAHHKLFALLQVVEPGLAALNLVFLGAVALVPYPTSLIGADPSAPTAAATFIGLFLLVNLLYLLMLLRAQAAKAWRQAPSDDLVPWIIGGWLAVLALMAVAMVMSAVWSALAGLVIVALSGFTVAVAMAILAPPAHREWF